MARSIVLGSFVALALLIQATALLGTPKSRVPNTGGGSARFTAFSQFLLEKQAEILATVEEEDGSGRQFARDPWERPEDGSFGVTTCLEDGDLVEKGAASVSVIRESVTYQCNKSSVLLKILSLTRLGHPRWFTGY